MPLLRTHHRKPTHLHPLTLLLHLFIRQFILFTQFTQPSQLMHHQHHKHMRHLKRTHHPIKHRANTSLQHPTNQASRTRNLANLTSTSTNLILLIKIHMTNLTTNKMFINWFSFSSYIKNCTRNYALYKK